jgi:hypothetical protein
VVEVGLAHRPRERAAPIRFMEVDKHPIDDIFGIFIECFRLSRIPSESFEIG